MIYQVLRCLFKSELRKYYDPGQFKGFSWIFIFGFVLRKNDISFEFRGRANRLIIERIQIIIQIIVAALFKADLKRNMK